MKLPMKVSKKINKILLLLACTFLVFSCTKTVRYKSKTEQLKPLATKVKKLVLHEDYIFAESNAAPLKDALVKSIQNSLNGQSRFEVEFISSGNPVPRNNSNNALLFIVGDVWLHRGKVSGNSVKKFSRNRRGFNYEESWDELENRRWEKDQLQTIVSLYFIEVGAETRLLRSTITASNDSRQSTWSGSRKLSDSQSSSFFSNKKLQAAHSLIAANTSILNQSNVFQELANKATAKHFSNL